MSFLNKEIDFIGLLNKLFQARKVIFVWTCLFLVLGVFVALISPKMFTAETIFVPQIGNEQQGGSLSGLASLAGIRVPNTGNASDILPSLYPRIVSSIPFKRELLGLELRNSEHETLRDYILIKNKPSFLSSVKKYTIDLPGTLLSRKKVTTVANDEGEIFRVSQRDKTDFDFLDKTIAVNVNDKEGFIMLSASLEDPAISAEIVKAATTLLQSRIIDYKNISSREQLKFTNSQYSERKVEYNALQDSIARFKDSNRNIVSALNNNRLSRLESDFSILASVFRELAIQVEKAKIQVNKDTPIFTVIEPVSIPISPSSSRRITTVITYTIIGFLMSVFFCLIYPLVVFVKKQVLTKGDN